MADRQWERAVLIRHYTDRLGSHYTRRMLVLPFQPHKIDSLHYLNVFYCYTLLFYVTGVSACRSVLGTMTHSLCTCHLARKLYSVVLYTLVQSLFQFNELFLSDIIHTGIVCSDSTSCSDQTLTTRVQSLFWLNKLFWSDIIHTGTVSVLVQHAVLIRH